jgi:hypothetical protein
MNKRFLKSFASLFTLFIIFFLSGCAFNKVEVKKPELLNKNKTVFVFLDNDKAQIRQTIVENFTRLGFTITEDKPTAGLYVDFNGNCGFDVFHYTCMNFNMFVTDAVSKEIVFQSSFFGDTPFSAKTLINNMFIKVEKELSKKAILSSPTP